MFCGVGKIPKDKVRGTPEYCASKNQVRYYGLVKIDEKLLNKHKKNKTYDLQKELIKAKNLEWDGKYLVRQANNLKVIINNENEPAAKIKRAEKKLQALRKKRDILVIKQKKQSDLIKKIKKQEEEEAKMKAKEKSKSGSKSKK